MPAGKPDSEFVTVIVMIQFKFKFKFKFMFKFIRVLQKRSYG